MIFEVDTVKWVEETLRLFPFIMWDRFIVGDIVDDNDKPTGERSITVYGWIDREKDAYKDFVVLFFQLKVKRVYYVCSSSDKYSERIAEIMGKKEHNKCERVEQTFKIVNAVKLRGKDAND